MQYRPSGWEELKAKQMEGIPEILGGNRDFFIEAGADAYEEGLKKTQVTTADILYWWTIAKGRKERKKGYLVFISEE